MIFLLSICGILWFVHICLDRLDLYQNNASCKVQIFFQFSAPVVLYFERGISAFCLHNFCYRKKQDTDGFLERKLFFKEGPFLSGLPPCHVFLDNFGIPFFFQFKFDLCLVVLDHRI